MYRVLSYKSRVQGNGIRYHLKTKRTKKTIVHIVHADEELQKNPAPKYTFSRGESLVSTPKSIPATALSSKS